MHYVSLANEYGQSKRAGIISALPGKVERWESQVEETASWMGQEKLALFFSLELVSGGQSMMDFCGVHTPFSFCMAELTWACSCKMLSNRKCL